MAHAKRFCPDAALRAAIACSEVLGAYGWLLDHPLARMIALAVEDEARAHGLSVLNLDVRETQSAAVQLYQSLGYTLYGTHTRYARVGSAWVAGLYFWKDLTAS